ncbi:MAG: hypothetical protein FJ190_01455 [Gammaproteobacteria bacterium]|nr:hypothetical protein [Gammaproteobacteria bacterium]
MSDSYIRKNKNILWVNDKIDLMAHVPNYMLWCLKNRDEGNLICDYTISALAEFGRNKNPKDENLNFKFLCNKKQKEVVSRFLNWCYSNVLCHEEKLSRTIKRWEASP